jgi:ribosome-associated protein
VQAQELLAFVLDKLDDMKAKDIVSLDVREKSNVTDSMVICSGTSNRHTRSIADHLAKEAKKAGISVLGIEGSGSGEWVLIDLGDVIAHVMQEESRSFYQLEKLWSV